MSTMPVPPFSPTRRSFRVRDRIIVAGFLTLMIVGLAGMTPAPGWDAMRGRIDALDWPRIGALLALSAVGFLLRGMRWHIFARRLGLDTGVAQNLRHFLGGLAMSVTPGRSGEQVRMRWIARETGWAFERTAPLALVDRALDTGALTLVLTLSLALGAGGIAGAVPVIVLAIGAAVLVTRPTLLGRVALSAYRSSGIFPRLFVRLRHASLSLARFSHPGTLVLALGVGSVGYLAEGYAFYLLLQWLGADIAVWAAVSIFVCATLAGRLAGTPGGIGGAGATMIVVLAALGVPLDIAVPATIIIRVTTLWFAVLIGLALFRHAEARSRQGRHALEQG